MAAKLTKPMTEALIVALTYGSVWVGARWKNDVGYVKTGTVCALINRDTIMRNPRGEWELSRKGWRALAEVGIITTDQYINAVLSLRKVIDEAHAEAIEMDECREDAARETNQQSQREQIEHMLDNPPTVAELIKTHPDTVNVDDLGRRVQQTASGHLISFPAELCDHGIDITRRCSICREDAAPKSDEVWETTPMTVKVVRATEHVVHFIELTDGTPHCYGRTEFERRFRKSS